MQEEADLIDKAQAGDREAVNALVALHWQPLYRFLAYKVGDREEARSCRRKLGCALYALCRNIGRMELRSKAFCIELQAIWWWTIGARTAASRYW